MTDADRVLTLPEIEAAIWRELVRAVHDKHHEWRTLVLATAAGGMPDARSVILREVDVDARRLVIYTDARACKVQQLQAQALPQAMLVMWSRRLSWQLRLRVDVEVHIDGLAVTSRWASLQSSPAATDYLAPQAPGTPADPAIDAAAAAAPILHPRHHFALLMAQVRDIDWLELRRDGHRRAAFDGHGARWLVP